jgi:hypothetical protein
VLALWILIVVAALAIALVVIIALDPGPTPSDVAIAYEEAWDRLDFDTLWTLSGTELRDQRTRADFLRAKGDGATGCSALAERASQVEVDDELVGSDLAVVHTRLRLRDGASVRNQVELAFRDGAWKVIGYRLEGAPPATSPN